MIWPIPKVWAISSNANLIRQNGKLSLLLCLGGIFGRRFPLYGGAADF